MDDLGVPPFQETHQVSGGQVVGRGGYMEDLRERAGSHSSYGDRASQATRTWGSGHRLADIDLRAKLAEPNLNRLVHTLFSGP